MCWDRGTASPMVQLEVPTQELIHTKASCCPVAICQHIQCGIGMLVPVWGGMCLATHGVYPLSRLPPSYQSSPGVAPHGDIISRPTLWFIVPTSNSAIKSAIN